MKMYSVKREFGGEICRCCLSTDRRLSPLANFDLFFTLLDDKQKMEALNTTAMLLCWECNASLRRVKQFQTQAQNAHAMLEQIADELPIQGLSQLSISHKQDYDVIIEDCPDCIDIDDLPITPVKDDETKVQIIELHLNENDDHDFEYNDNFQSNDRSDVEEEATDDYLEKTVNSPLKKSKRKPKIVIQPKSDIKRKKIETNINTETKSHRRSLRISGQIIPELHPLNKNNGNKKGVKTKIKGNNTVKNTKPKKLPKKKITEIKVKKENKTPGSDVITAEDVQNELVNINTEADTDTGENPKEKIQTEYDEIEQSDDLSDDDSQSDPCNDDPDFEEDLNETDKDKNTERVNKRPVVATDKLRMCFKRIRFIINKDFDECFTKVDLSPEDVKDILDNELSYKSEELPYSCSYCGLCFRMNKSLLKHKRQRHKTIAKSKNAVPLMCRCNICQKTMRKGHIEAHMKYVHRFRYRCRECDKEFWDMEEGKDHFKLTHTDYRCGLCSKLFKFKRGLDGHTRDHHTPFKCDVCGHVARGLHYLRAHRLRRHDDSAPERRYCVTCDRQFSSLRAYHNHTTYYCRAHARQPQERAPCSECGKVLRNKLSLRYHYERYHAGKTRFHCPQCDKYFARSNGLRGHIKSVHLKQRAPKNKLCSICGRGFAHTRILTFHMRTHTGERPHACPHCPAAFSQPYPLQKHISTQHREAPEKKNEAPVTLA